MLAVPGAAAGATVGGWLGEGRGRNGAWCEDDSYPESRQPILPIRRNALGRGPERPRRRILGLRRRRPCGRVQRARQLLREPRRHASTTHRPTRTGNDSLRSGSSIRTSSRARLPSVAQLQMQAGLNQAAQQVQPGRERTRRRCALSAAAGQQSAALRQQAAIGQGATLARRRRRQRVTRTGRCSDRCAGRVLQAGASAGAKRSSSPKQRYAQGFEVPAAGRHDSAGQQDTNVGIQQPISRKSRTRHRPAAGAGAAARGMPRMLALG